MSINGFAAVSPAQTVQSAVPARIDLFGTAVVALAAMEGFSRLMVAIISYKRGAPVSLAEKHRIHAYSGVVGAALAFYGLRVKNFIPATAFLAPSLFGTLCVFYVAMHIYKRVCVEAHAAGEAARAAIVAPQQAAAVRRQFFVDFARKINDTLVKPLAEKPLAENSNIHIDKKQGDLRVVLNFITPYVPQGSERTLEVNRLMQNGKFFIVEPGEAINRVAVKNTNGYVDAEYQDMINQLFDEVGEQLTAILDDHLTSLFPLGGDVICTRGPLKEMALSFHGSTVQRHYPLVFTHNGETIRGSVRIIQSVDNSQSGEFHGMKFSSRFAFYRVSEIEGVEI
jgi:hypothetical protein